MPRIPHAIMELFSAENILVSFFTTVIVALFINYLPTFRNVYVEFLLVFASFFFVGGIVNFVLGKVASRLRR